MSPKLKKKKQQQQKQPGSSNNKKPHKSKPWPDLPKQVLNTIGKHPTLENNIHFGGFIKSWRSAPKCCNPNSSTQVWLHLFDPDSSYHEKYQFYAAQRAAICTSFPAMVWGCWCRCFLRTLTKYPWKNYVGCSNGILVAEDVPLYVYNLWNPVEKEWYHLPLWDPQVPLKLAVISSSPGDKNCAVMVLTGASHPAFAFHKLVRNGSFGERPEWIKQDCTLFEPQSFSDQSARKQVMKFTNAIGFKGKFYALSLQGTLAVIEEVDSCFKVTALTDTRAIPSVSSSHFTEYLLESDGEILLVFLISRKSSVNIVDDVEIYKLNMNRLSWAKLESIGGRTLFVGSNCCVSVSASKVGSKRNSVYFRQPVGDEWWIYDMESNSITKSPAWIEPTEQE